MTFIVTFLVGLGGLLIASSLDCSSLKDTFTAIVQNKPIDWSGSKQCAPTTGGITQPTGNLQCPSGYKQYTIPATGKVICYKPRCPDGTCKCYGPGWIQTQAGVGGPDACDRG